MAEVLAKMTRISAVNSMLRSIGEATVPSLSTPYDSRADVQAAEAIIDDEGRSVQAEGWWFNMERTTLQPDVNSNILISDTIIDVKMGAYSPEKIYVERGGMLYNRTDNTNIFASEVELILTTLIPFEELPETARRYITMRAARVLSEVRVGDPQLRQFSAQDEAQARMHLQELQGEHESFNVFKDSEAANLVNSGLR